MGSKNTFEDINPQSLPATAKPARSFAFPCKRLFLCLVMCCLVIDVYASCSQGTAKRKTGTEVNSIQSANDDTCEALIINDQQSEIVKTLSYTGDFDRVCRGIGMINNTLLASVEVQEFGCELWRIDPNGRHELFADIKAGEVGSDVIYDFGRSPLFNGWHYFGADDGVNGYRLWRTDGVNLEQVTEVEPVPGGFGPHGGPWGQVVFGGRNYFRAWSEQGQMHEFYSTDGLTMRAEPHDPLPGNPPVEVRSHHTLFDKMIGSTSFSGLWVFDGIEYQLLEDPVPTVDDLNAWNLWFYFDEAWVFRADFINDSGFYEFGHFYTDGSLLKQIPHTGTAQLNHYNAMGGFIRTREFQYAIAVPQAGYGQGGIPIFRVSSEASSDYELTVNPGENGYSSGAAILDNRALVLLNNTLLELGESSAQVLPFELPTDWEGSEFKFVGSDAYYHHAYIKETNPLEGSRVWAWNFGEAGLLMADESNPVTDVDFFRHIDKDIYFYGEDQANGWALRRIPNATVRRLPLLAKVTGSWFDPDTSGQGLVLHPIDDERTVFSFFGFENDGSHLWLTGVSTQPLEHGKSVTVNMTINSGGNFGDFTPGEVSSETWGTMDITFDTCSKGTAIFNGLSGQQTMNISLLTSVEGIDCYYVDDPPAPGTAGITGSWYDPSTSGQGLILHSMNDQQMVVSFYGYNNDRERTWLIGLYTGQMEFEKTIVMDMELATGGAFGNFDPENVTRTSWGTLTINFADCHHAIATLNGLDGQQTMDLGKLAGLDGSELACH